MEEIPCEGEELEEDSTLKEALSLMLLKGEDRIPVRGGSISFNRILQVVGRDINEKA
jgi:hypothetical protein